MTWLLPEQISALNELQAACETLGSDAVIIGAAAYRAWFGDPGRYTQDVDVAVAVDMEEFAILDEALNARGWRQDASREHRWHTPANARVDILPVGRKPRSAGRIEWPRSGMVMELVGFEHVFDQAVTRETSPGTSFRVIPVPVLALLKIASFLDSPYDRQKVAQDILAIFERYELEGDRRFSAEICDAGVSYECAGAFLLGQDLARLCKGSEAELVEKFICSLQNGTTAEAMAFARATGGLVFDESGGRRRAILAAFSAAFSQVAGRGTALKTIAKEAFEPGLHDRMDMPEGGEDE